MNVRSGQICIDIGAGFGFYSHLFAKLVSPNGKVYCFEPEELNAIRTKKKLEKYIVSGVSCVEEMAVSNVKENVRLEVDYSNPANHKISSNESGRIVRATKLDDYLKNLHSIPDLVKIDTQGHELQVLQCAEILVKALRTRFIIEMDPKSDVRSAIAVFEFMLKNSYIAHTINKNGTLKIISEFPKISNYIDMIFIPSDL